MKKIAIINGPNLERLGKREPEIYGSTTLDELCSKLTAQGKELDLEVQCHQSNSESELVNIINTLADQKVDGLIINPAAYSHTSIAIRDAIAGSDIPTIEVHISNIYSREAFRHKTMTAGVCKGVISGLGLQGYHLALQYFSSL